MSNSLAKQALERGIDVLSGYVCDIPQCGGCRIMPLDEQIAYRVIAGVPVFFYGIENQETICRKMVKAWKKL